MINSLRIAVLLPTRTKPSDINLNSRYWFTIKRMLYRDSWHDGDKSLSGTDKKGGRSGNGKANGTGFSANHIEASPERMLGMNYRALRKGNRVYQ